MFKTSLLFITLALPLRLLGDDGSGAPKFGSGGKWLVVPGFNSFEGKPAYKDSPNVEFIGEGEYTQVYKCKNNEGYVVKLSNENPREIAIITEAIIQHARANGLEGFTPTFRRGSALLQPFVSGNKIGPGLGETEHEQNLRALQAILGGRSKFETGFRNANGERIIGFVDLNSLNSRINPLTGEVENFDPLALYSITDTDPIKTVEINDPELRAKLAELAENLEKSRLRTPQSIVCPSEPDCGPTPAASAPEPGNSKSAKPKNSSSRKIKVEKPKLGLGGGGVNRRKKR